MPNSSPPNLEDSLWVENPLAGMLMNFQSDGELEQLLGNLERLAA
jgi:hypothetical protein